MFVDECEKCKDLIHVHSFAHDFHLRSIQSCISGKTVYKSYYHLTGFLSDFILVYPYPPGFSRNFLLTGIPIILYHCSWTDSVFDLDEFLLCTVTDQDIGFSGTWFILSDSKKKLQYKREHHRGHHKNQLEQCLFLPI